MVKGVDCRFINNGTSPLESSANPFRNGWIQSQHKRKRRMKLTPRNNGDNSNNLANVLSKSVPYYFAKRWLLQWRNYPVRGNQIGDILINIGLVLWLFCKFLQLKQLQRIDYRIIPWHCQSDKPNGYVVSIRPVEIENNQAAPLSRGRSQEEAKLNFIKKFAEALCLFFPVFSNGNLSNHKQYPLDTPSKPTEPSPRLIVPPPECDSLWDKQQKIARGPRNPLSVLTRTRQQQQQTTFSQ